VCVREREREEVGRCTTHYSSWILCTVIIYFERLTIISFSKKYRTYVMKIVGIRTFG